MYIEVIFGIIKDRISFSHMYVMFSSDAYPESQTTMAFFSMFLISFSLFRVPYFFCNSQSISKFFFNSGSICGSALESSGLLMNMLPMMILSSVTATCKFFAKSQFPFLVGINGAFGYVMHTKSLFEFSIACSNSSMCLYIL